MASIGVFASTRNSPTNELLSAVCTILTQNTSTTKVATISPITHAIPIDTGGVPHYSDAIQVSLGAISATGTGYTVPINVVNPGTASANYTIARIALSNCPTAGCDSTNEKRYFDYTLSTPVAVSSGNPITLDPGSSITSTLTLSSSTGFTSVTVAGRGKARVVLQWLKDGEATTPQVRIDKMVLADSTASNPDLILSTLTLSCDTTASPPQVVVTASFTPTTTVTYDTLQLFINNTIEVLADTFTPYTFNAGTTYSLEVRL